MTPNLGRPYKITDELCDLSTMAMEYFKEKIEPCLPEITYFGSDFFDAASYPGMKYLNYSMIYANDYFFFFYKQPLINYTIHFH